MPAICPNCETQFRYDWCQDQYVMFVQGKEVGICATIINSVKVGDEEVSMIHHLCECGLIVSIGQESDSIGMVFMSIDDWKGVDWELDENRYSRTDE